MGKRPMVWFLCSFFAGMILIRYQQRGAPDFVFWIESFIVLLLSVGVYFLSKRIFLRNQNHLQKKPFFILFCPLFFLLGMLRMGQAVSDGVLEPVLAEHALRAIVKGTVIQLSEKEDYEQIRLTNVSVRNQEQWLSCEDVLVRMELSGKCVSLSLGQEISAAGDMKLFSRATNPGQFDAYSYYRSEGIYYQLQTSEVQILDSRENPLSEWLRGVKNTLRQVYLDSCDEQTAGCLCALVLGDKDKMQEEQKESFRQTGVFHMFSISGMHFSILTGVLSFLFCRIGFPKKISMWLSAAFCLFYWMMIGQGVSSSRAFVMFLCSAVALSALRGYDSVSAMCVAVILLLIRAPLMMEQASFLMSFGAICGILLIYQPYLELEQQRNDKQKNGEKTILKRGRKLFLSIRHSLFLSFSVELVLLPILLSFTYEFSFAGLLLNLVFLPMLPVAYLLSILGGMAGVMFLPFGVVLLKPAACIFSFYTWASSRMEQVSFLSYTPGSPGIYRVLVFYGLLGGFLLLLRWYQKRRVFLFLVCLFVLLIPSPFSDCWVTILDVGQGDAIVIGDTAGKTIVIDGGSSSVHDVGMNRIIPFLKWKGIHTVDFWLITHADYDHYSGLKELLEKDNCPVQIREIGLPKSQKGDEAICFFEQQAAEKGISVSYIGAGDSILADGVYTCIHPEEDYESQDANSGSLVFVMQYNNFKGLFTGDLDEAGEHWLVEHDAVEPVTLLKVGHHGSASSSSEAFLDCLMPSLSVISAGKNNRYHHPSEEVLKRLRQTGSNILCTMDTGAVTIHTDGENVRVEAYLKK